MHTDLQDVDAAGFGARLPFGAGSSWRMRFGALGVTLCALMLWAVQATAQSSDVTPASDGPPDNPRDIPEATPTVEADPWDIPQDILAIVGDVAYGEYLSSECLTCHQVSGADAGIPAITEWPEEDFVIAMHHYKKKLRPHPVMQMMAGRLSNDEIAALAAYFATLTSQ